VFFKIVGKISDIETIASGKGIREARRLRKLYGGHAGENGKELRPFNLRVARYDMPRCIGMRPMA